MTSDVREKQVIEYAGGNEIAAVAIKQIGYDLMGYYPITPSTQIAENLDEMRAKGETDLIMIAAEGEHSAAGICYGASVGGGRVINATSAVGNALSDGDECGVQDGFGTAFHQGRPQRYHVSAKCGVADPVCAHRAAGL